MRHILRTMFIASALVVTLGVSLTGCSTLKSVVGQNGVDDARKAAGAAMTVYKESWQPLLAVYGGLATCSATQKAPCKDAALYKKLYDLDGQVATCTVAATIALNETNPDFSGVSACVSSINQAELEFAKAGIVK